MTASRRDWRSGRGGGSWAGCRAARGSPRSWARPDQRTYNLTDLALRYLHRELKVDNPVDDGQLTFDGFGDNTEAEQNLMVQARATLDLAAAIGSELSREDDSTPLLLETVELPLVEVLAATERTGIAADTQYLSELEAHFAAE